ncbi:hypothetical protein [Acidaminobacter hydrogenoformans]|uniref:Uncharacterized protein n=1 Tax=Acidaminobacter hydrogenoformans DSM 2784 TaxID=1120920 RepID=A0A1G5S287_9FIRM|nr:hypothetical protein [Acidaminobacter hydrogenoformans]SCZ80484.1 hypothetical protein SAMN03080599_02294 [Acidaminobacter hydrogenoformans DSM 2784]
MRFCVIDKKRNKKTFLRIDVKSRDELMKKINSERFIIDNEIYSVNDVIAVPTKEFKNWRDIIMSGRKSDIENARKFNKEKINRSVVKG